MSARLARADTSPELVATLLRAWTDFFPYPTAPALARSVKRGPTDDEGRSKIECRQCDGSGELPAGRSQVRKCSVCRGRGFYRGDQYTEQAVIGAEASWSDVLGRGTVDCDACGGYGHLGAHANTKPDRRTARICERCEGVGKLSALLAGRQRIVEEEHDREEDHVLAALEQNRRERESLQCYHDIERCLGHFQDGIRAVLVLTYVDRAQRPTRESKVGLSSLCAMLPERMYVPVEVIAEIAARARNEAARKLARARRGKGPERAGRDAEIRQLAARGSSVREIAERVGLGKSRVAELLAA